MRCIETTDIRRAEKLATISGLPIGKCLVLLDCITEEAFRATLEAQALLRDKVFDSEIIFASLDIVHRQKWTLSDALLSLGCDSHLTRKTRLGELLCDAHILDSKQISLALKAADYSCLPLGKVLGSFNQLNSTIINECLQLQSAIRHGTLERSSAIVNLTDLNEELQSTSYEVRHYKIGELLVGAGIISSDAIAACLTAAAHRQIPIGRYLIEETQLSEPLLLSALCLQDLIDAQLLQADMAFMLLKRIESFSAEEARLSEHLSLFDFLRAAGFLTAQKRQILMDKMSKMFSGDACTIRKNLQDVSAFSQILLQAFPEDTGLCKTGMVLHQLLTTGKLTTIQAILALSIRENRKRGTAFAAPLPICHSIHGNRPWQNPDKLSWQIRPSVMPEALSARTKLQTPAVVPKPGLSVSSDPRRGAGHPVSWCILVLRSDRGRPWQSRS